MKENERKKSSTGLDRKWFGIIGVGALAVIVLVVWVIAFYRDDIVSPGGEEDIAMEQPTFGIEDFDIATQPQFAPPPFSDVDYVVARINGSDILESDVRYSMSMIFPMLEWEYFNLFPDGWEIDPTSEFRDGMTFEQVMREEAVRLAGTVVLYEEFATARGISLSNETLQTIENDIEEIFQEFGPAEFYQILLEEGIRDREHLVRIFASHELIDEVVHFLMNSPGDFAMFEQYMPENEQLIANERAEEILIRANAGEDFSMLIETYGEDPGMISNPDGYTFTRGDMVPEFEEATLALEIGGISELVQTSFGYHIIKRVEPIPENIMPGATFDSEDDLLGAKHILIPFTARSHESRMIEAIHLGFESMIDNADLTLLPELEQIPARVQ